MSAAGTNVAEARRQLAVEESERGLTANVRGTVDPRLGVPWSSVLLVLAGLGFGALTVWPAALPFIGIGVGLFTPVVGARMYGLTVGRGKIDLIGAETLPMHHVDSVRQDGRVLVLVGAERTVRLDLDTSLDNVAFLADRLQAAVEALGDEEDVPDTLADLQRDAAGGGEA